jgi:phosphoserine aminotransferase
MSVHARKPALRPANPNFSSGPCTKRPGWSLDSLANGLFGRSHRSKPGKARLKEVIDRTRDILQIPADYRIAIVPASDTGAVEMAMWSLLGPRPVEVLAWENFGNDWVIDILEQLRLPAAQHRIAPYGELPDLSAVDPNHDVVFTWNGTTAGVRVPNGDWIAHDRAGLTICDATSAAFAMELPWAKLDAVTWSWQKAMGGEAQHGMLVLSPRAVERLLTHTPAWPLPKLFRMTQNGKLSEGLFEGETINTPSMLAVEDALDGLKWAQSIGGLKTLIQRSESNLAAIAAWVERTPWIEFLAMKPETRSNTGICLRIVDPWFLSLDKKAQSEIAKRLVDRLESEGVGYDFGSYRTAPPGIRIWGGATVERTDIEALLPWLDYAWAEIASKAERTAA